MDDLTRRDALKLTAGAGLATAMVGVADAAPDDAPKSPMTDRECVMAAGMTEAEADCWALAAKLAGAFFDLPELHPSDNAEVADAIHILQNKLLSRPTYRRYLELAKKAHGK